MLNDVRTNAVSRAAPIGCYRPVLFGLASGWSEGSEGSLGRVKVGVCIKMIYLGVSFSQIFTIFILYNRWFWVP